MTYIIPAKKSEWFTDYDDILSTSKRIDEVLSYTFDLSDALNDSETISSATWASDGVTINSSSNTDTTATVTVTGNGEAGLTVVTSDGRTLQYQYRWIAKDGAPGDYDS